ncbi:RNA-binding protein [Clostridium amazonitimonense]|uniref:YlmH family RNA-binding protein n=1 Tax=Clostridium amazonitimonense TaxID=1499689 RepID=UPI0005095183|nr:YlmH/Sll1252 family protein [Clostridium amazonitimonense]
MNKNDFIKFLGDDDIGAISNIYDKIILADRRLTVVYTNEFLTPNLWKKVKEYCYKINMPCCTFGGFEDAERRIIRFNNNYESNYPIEIIRITNKSKFNELLHKDYLGSLMSLGIKRSKLGDLVLKDNQCYVPVMEDIVDYILINLKNIGRCPCEIDKISKEEDIPEYSFDKNVYLASSNRLDVIISSITNLSRNKSEQYIRSGKVFLDYIECYEKSEEIKSGDTITIRGHGKYKIGEIVGTTGSGRLKIEIKKYI